MARFFYRNIRRIGRRFRVGTVLCYNFDGGTFEKLAAFAVFCGAGAKAVSRSDYSKPLRALLGEAADDTPDGGDFSEPMLVLCGFDGKSGNAFLGYLREAKLSAGVIKAFLTETNAGWSSSALYRELCSERAAFEKLRPSGEKK
jgi:hypothetical protein